MSKIDNKKLKDAILNLSHQINELDRAVETKIKKNKNLIKFKEITQAKIQKEQLFQQIEEDIAKIEQIIESK